MKTILMEEPTGCGFAAVATVMQIPYAEVKAKANSMGIFAEDEKLYSDTQYVRKLLKEYNVKISGEELPFKSWDELPDLAVLSINRGVEDNGLVTWHWVVFHRENGKTVVLDSSPKLEKNDRVDFDNIQPAWYIEAKKA